MKLHHWLRYLLTYDTTWQGQFRELRTLLLTGSTSLPAEGERYVVDVGANDGFYSSNSHPFIRRGWRALLIEPHPYAFALASKRYAGNDRVRLLNLACSDKAGELPLHMLDKDFGGSRSSLNAVDAPEHDGRAFTNAIKVQVDTLESVLDRLSAPQEFGLLSIDTEGQDLQVLSGANLARYRPKVIITENGAQENDKREYLRRHHYRLHAQLPADTVWVKA
jgi:FkbM family methyltransferase